MPRYWLVILVGGISYYNYNYGQIEEKKSLPVVTSSVSPVTEEHPSPERPSLPSPESLNTGQLPSLQHDSNATNPSFAEPESHNVQSIQASQPSQEYVSPEMKEKKEEHVHSESLSEGKQENSIPTRASDTSDSPSGSHEEESLPDIIGIDTVNVETASGNWLLKRIWFERAQEQYEKTKALFDKVLELRFAFFAKRTELDRTLFDPFYMKVGIGQGELLEVINRLLQDFQEMRTREGALNAQENSLYERVEQEKETLERLQKDVTGVTEIDAAIETAINQLIEQVNICRTYEKQSWEAFKEISKQLSDKKARELYYVMDTYRKNSNNIVLYLQRDYSQYMQLLERMAHEQIDRIMTTIDQLKQKNVDFKEQAHLLEQKRYAQESGNKGVIVPEDEEENAEPEGIIGRVWSAVCTTVSSVWYTVQAGLHGIYSLIWRSGEESEEHSEIKPVTEK